MRSMLLKEAVLIAALSLAAACGDSGDTTPAAVCTQTGNMSLYSSGTGTTLLSRITVTAFQFTSVPSVLVFVGYLSPPVGAILGGYPADAVDPLTFGIDIVQFGADSDNPLEFRVTFNANRAKATYNAVLRFVAADTTLTGPVGCQDVPVTFTVN